MRKLRKALVVAVAVISLAFFVVSFAKETVGRYFYSSDKNGEDFIKVMDVGQADSILIYSNGQSALIDAGIKSSADAICENLEILGIEEIDVCLITHLHMDHAGGLLQVAEEFKIKNLILPELNASAEATKEVATAKSISALSGGKSYTAVQGMSFEVGDFEITVIYYDADNEDENNQSIVAMAELDGKKFLFTGDAESEIERAMIKDGLNLDCDVLKVGHHGSNSSSAVAFLKEATPDYAAISVGEGNMYSHPSLKVINALENKGAIVYRTDKNGDITFYVEKGDIRVETEEAY